MDKTILNFYWSNKPDKVKRDTIRGPSELGGRGLINISCKLNAFLLKWLQKYAKAHHGKWKFILEFWILKANDNQNLSWFVFNNPNLSGSKLPSFYRDLIQAFKMADGIMKPNVTCINEALEMPLWNNTIITNTDNKLDSKILKPCGMLILKHVVKNGKFMTTQELAAKCNIKAINAGKIMSSLKKHVSGNLLSENREGPASHVSSMLHLNLDDQECVSISDITVKQTYQSMIRKRFIPPAAEKVLPVKLNICPNTVDWGEIWKKANNKNIDHEDKDLWFRLRHRIVPTNNILRKMNKIRPHENQCGICKQEEETIEHLFIYCKHTWPSWLFLENVLRKYKGNKHFCLNDSNRILGCGKQIGTLSLILIAKLHRTIWISRCHNINGKKRD